MVSNYTQLLQKAIRHKKNPSTAVKDLLQYASEAATAVDEVTRGKAVLELQPVSSNKAVYQLTFCLVGSEAPPSDLGVYALNEAGQYPVCRWHSRTAWEAMQPGTRSAFLDSRDLKKHFKSMVSHPDSRLVMFVTFVQQHIKE